jgi:LPXTG-motif cell wall-anchored protein
MRLRKQKKAVAVTLATAIAVSTISASASAVSYDLANGDVTIDQDEHKGAYSYQGENGNRTYVNEDKDDDGKIIIKQNDKETATSNTVTVKEDVKKTDNADSSEGRDVDIVIDGVNADTSETGKSTVTVGEGADVDLTVKDSTLTTGGNGIDIGKDLDRNDENKDTKVDLTLEDTTTIKLTDKNSAGLDVRQGSDVDLTLKGDNIIDGSAAIDSATKEAESKGKKFTDINANVEGIRVGGETASDSSDAKKDAHLTIKGDKDETADTTEETSGGSLTIQDTTTGMVIAGGSDEKDSSVTITDGADVTIQDTHVSGSTQSGSGVIQHGDLTIEDGSSLTIDKVDNGGSNSKGNGIASWNDIIVKAKSKLNIKGTSNGIYGHQDSDANLTVDDSTLDITDSGAGIRYEGGAADGSHTSAGDITFKNSDVNIAADSIGITTGDHGKSNITFDHTEATITASSSSAIHAGDAVGTNGNLTVTNGSNLDLNGFHGIWAGFDTVMISGHSTVNSTSVAQGIRFLGNKATGLATKLYVTDNSQYNLFGGGDQNWAVDASSNPGALIKIDGNSILLVDHNDSNAGIVLGKNGKLIVDNGTVLVKGNYVDSGSYKGTGILAYGNDASILIKDNSHVESTSITRYPRRTGQKLVVTGGTLTYDYSLANTLWPENEQGNKLTNFLLTKDAQHADFGTFAYNGTEYRYVSDLNKETDKQHLSVWVPAAALEYMLDVDGSHDPEIIGKLLADLETAGYHFNTAYKTPDGVIVLRDMVVNGHSLNFTKTTDADGNTKLIWGNYEKQADGAPNAYDMVYGTEYEYEGQKYTIVWGFEHKNNADGSTADGLNQNILDAFDADSNVKVTGENITGENADDYTVTIYGALREVVDPTPDPEPTPDPTPDPDQPDTPVTPEDPTNPPVQDATPDAPAETPVTPENPANPPVQDAAPDAPASTVSTLPKTGVNWIAALAMGLSGLTLMAAGAFTSLFRKSRH